MMQRELRHRIGGAQAQAFFLDLEVRYEKRWGGSRVCAFTLKV